MNTLNIAVAWRDPSHTVLVQDFNTRWTLDDYFATVERTYAMIDTVDHPVDVIVDVSGDPASASRLIAAAGEAANATSGARVHRNQRLMVVVGGGQMMRTVVQMADRYAPRIAATLFAADTLDEARVVINRQRRAG